MLKQAGPVSPTEVDVEILQSYVGRYRSEEGIEFNVTVKDGKLHAALGGQESLSLMAVDQSKFKSVAFDNYGAVTFNVESGKILGCSLRHGGRMQLKRVQETVR